MKIILAPDSFKESLSAREAAEAMKAGVLRAAPNAQTVLLPLADGGEGTVDALVAATGGRVVEREVADPLGRPVKARFGLLGDAETAVVEMAAASGLALVEPEKRDIMRSSTYGTGELIRACLDEGARKIIVGIGGSATTDAGCGMARALGAKLLDADGNELAGNGEDLARLAHIDMSAIDARLKETDVLVACDVTNPLYGPQGAAHTYGPQKGATGEQVKLLDAGLANFAGIVAKDLKIDTAQLPGAGAAGGLGAGLVAFTGAKLASGVDLVLDAAGFDEKIKDADLIITGEGKIDATTPNGKTIAGVVRAAKGKGAKIVALAGTIDLCDDILAEMGLDGWFSITPGSMELKEAMARAPELIESAAFRLLFLKEK